MQAFSGYNWAHIALCATLLCVGQADGQDDKMSMGEVRSKPRVLDPESDCFLQDCLNGGWCIDGTPRDAKFMCLCTEGWTRNPNNAEYSVLPALCDTRAVVEGAEVIVLNEPLEVPPAASTAVNSSSTTVADNSGSGGDNETTEIVLGLFVGIMVIVLVGVVIGGYLLLNQEEEQEKDPDVNFLRSVGLDDVANSVRYKPFEYGNPLAERRSVQSVGGGHNTSTSSEGEGYLDVAMRPDQGAPYVGEEEKEL